MEITKTYFVQYSYRITSVMFTDYKYSRIWDLEKNDVYGIENYILKYESEFIGKWERISDIQILNFNLL